MKTTKDDTMDDLCGVEAEFVHLARLALSGRPQDVQLLVRRVARRHRDESPAMADRLLGLLRESPTRLSPLRRESVPTIPVDVDSRIQLVRNEMVTELEVEPVFSADVRGKLDQLVLERRALDQLDGAGLSPTRSALFTGMPGVGKTLAARWLARELRLPLLTLDLAAVMSSFLGRTGINVRHVLDYAKRVDCVLLLDELDAIAKRRDDDTEVGELKRLVTVLLQEIDDWPEGGLLIAATNHALLLDPAVWRRFEMVVEFPMPTEEAVAVAVRRFLSDVRAGDDWAGALSVVLRGLSFSDIRRTILQARREQVLSQNGEADPFEGVVRLRAGELPLRDRAELAVELVGYAGLSQRRVHELTGVSRDTIRRRSKGGQADT